MSSLLAVVNILGALLAFFSIFYLLPVVSGLVYQDGTSATFALAGSLNLILGATLYIATRRYHRNIKPRDGYLLVTLGWTLMAAAATIPLLLQMPELSFTDAYFEAMSGLSTTGATVLTGLDDLAPSLNLWRHALNWFGGMGIIVLAVAILPILGVGGMRLYRAETPGPVKDAKLTPRITQTAKLLWMVYAGLTIACFLALVLAGMPIFDAICHAFSTMALGGFSTKDASVGFYDSPVIEAVLIGFMLIAAINFAVHFLALRRMSLSVYMRDAEVRSMLGLIVMSCVLLAVYLRFNGVYDNYWTSLRYVSFNLVSIATDCGFVNTDYNQWPLFAPMCMLFLSCVSANAGSTGGGIKMFRSLLLVKETQRELFTLVHPQAVRPLRIGAQMVQEHIGRSILAFIFLYLMTIVVLTLILLASGLDFTSAFSAVIACINNMGPGLDAVGPASNYGTLTNFQTWVCTFAMFAGRIELFTVFVLFTPMFWQK